MRCRSIVTNSSRVVVAQNSPNSFFFGASSFAFPLTVFALLDVVAAAFAAPRHRPSRARRSRARDRPLKLLSRPERGRRFLRARRRLALVLVDLFLLLRHAPLNLLRVDVRPEPTEAFDRRSRASRRARRRRRRRRARANARSSERARERHRARGRHRVVDRSRASRCVGHVTRSLALSVARRGARVAGASVVPTRRRARTTTSAASTEKKPFFSQT